MNRALLKLWWIEVINVFGWFENENTLLLPRALGIKNTDTCIEYRLNYLRSYAWLDQHHIISSLTMRNWLGDIFDQSPVSVCWNVLQKLHDIRSYVYELMPPPISLKFFHPSSALPGWCAQPRTVCQPCPLQASASGYKQWQHSKGFGDRRGWQIGI